jgi:hypothetical protein
MGEAHREFAPNEAKAPRRATERSQSSAMSAPADETKPILCPGGGAPNEANAPSPHCAEPSSMDRRDETKPIWGIERGARLHESGEVGLRRPKPTLVLGSDPHGLGQLGDEGHGAPTEPNDPSDSTPGAGLKGPVARYALEPEAPGRDSPADRPPTQTLPLEGGGEQTGRVSFCSPPPSRGRVRVGGTAT